VEFGHYRAASAARVQRLACCAISASAELFLYEYFVDGMNFSISRRGGGHVSRGSFRHCAAEALVQTTELNQFSVAVVRAAAAPSSETIGSMRGRPGGGRGVT